MKKDWHHFRKYHAEYWSSDIKPKGKFKKYINSSARQNARKQIRNESKCHS